MPRRKLRRGSREESERAKQQELLAEKSTKRADEERKRADLQAKIAQSSVLAASLFSTGNDPDQSLALAVAAVKTQRTPAAERALRQAIAGSYIRAVRGQFAVKMVAVAYSTDGQQIATARVDGTTEVWDTATGRLNKNFDNVKVTGRGLAGLAFGGEGRYLTTVDAGGVVVVHDLASESAPRKFGPAGRPALEHVLHPRWLACGRCHR